MMSNLLSQEQRSLLEDVLDNIIPGSDEMPAAGLVASDFVERSAIGSVAIKRIVLDIVSATDAMAGLHHNKRFLDVSDSAKESLLKIVEEQNKGIFSDFVNLVYDGYYTNPSVIDLLGVDAGVPQPTGFSNPPFDPGIVDDVRMRGPRYRVV